MMIPGKGSGAVEVTQEFPILVYQEDGNWIAESILTGTIHVDSTPKEALDRVIELLSGEIQDAVDGSQSVAEAFRSIECPPRPDLLARFYRGWKSSKITRSGKKISFNARSADAVLA